MMRAETLVPVVDLCMPEAEAAAALRTACTEHGFFYWSLSVLAAVVNHGVPADCIARAFEAQRHFFSLPLEQKMAIQAGDGKRGYTPMGDWVLDPARSKVPDTHEAISFRQELPGRETSTFPLNGPNQWPSEDLVPGYRQAVEAYLVAAGALSMRMLRLLALSLGLPSDHFAPYFSMPLSALRPVHYSAAKSDPAAGAYGIGAHTDFGMMTFLLTDGEPGLQICPYGEWIDVTPMEGAYVCNVGDLLNRWTNGVYRSSLHRVVCTSGRERYSLPFFLQPNFDAVVEPLAVCCSEDRPAQFPAVVCGEHLMARLARSYKREAGGSYTSPAVARAG